MRMSLPERIVATFFRQLNQRIVWHRLPFPLALVNIVTLRADLRRFNLHDTQVVVPEAPPPGNFDFRRNRTPDGSYNDLAVPSMGQRDTRFGRNVPIKETYGEADEAMMTPNPRTVSRKLLARDEFIPATTLNVLAAAWLQFMVHDWFSHGPGDKNRLHRIKLEDGDDWPGDEMTVPRTIPDPKRSDAERERPDAYTNIETHWWDASQIYGSSYDRLDQVRRGPDAQLMPDGKLYLDTARDQRGHLPLENMAKGNGQLRQIELTGVNGNWWTGLSVMHTLFVREHNAICDRLKIEYPEMGGEELFQKARLINAALLAKIHTTEWTPALLHTPELRFGMRGNWWGFLGEDFYLQRGRKADSEVVSGIPGSPPDHHAAPYAITEEFSAVYRMHPLIPDDFEFRALDDDRPLKRCTLLELAGEHAHKLYDQVQLIDAVYSLGTSHPGALTLHNHPNALRRLPNQSHPKIVEDIGTIDILRDRERGVPRYCRFRHHLRMSVPKTFSELTDNPQFAQELEEIYGDVEKVDLLAGTLAEAKPKGFAFGDTAFRIFILMASRRLKSDRFFTTDYTPEVYTPVGMDWINHNGMRSVLVRHLPGLKAQLAGVKNAFTPWPGARV